MKRLIVSALLVVTLNVAGAEPVGLHVLDSYRVVRVLVARDRLTTIQFPSPISSLEGAYLAVDEEPPARFQISFQPGQSSFALRALATNVSTSLTVEWRKRLYVFELVESAEPVLVLSMVTPPAPPPPPLGSSLSPLRLRALFQTARLYSEVQEQHFDLITNAHCFVVNLRTQFPNAEALLERVYHFATDDTLVFQVRFRNLTRDRIAYLPSTLGARVGERTFVQSAAESDGVIPPCGESTSFFAISGGVNGVPAGIAPRNQFQISFEPLEPSSGRRCPNPGPVTVIPARSPKHANR